MSEICFNDEQNKAISLRNRSLLVSAAAGSGKTTVLVERIVRRILDTEHPCDVDRILIMTFTNAAAAQMREKITDAIEEERRKRPFDSRIRKQAALVHNAMITTIHGFCLNVLRNHFHEADLSPDFRVADEGETKLIRQDALGEILEEAYAAGDPGFVTVTEMIVNGKNDAALEDVINRLFDFAMSYPEPESWLAACVSLYEVFQDADLSAPEETVPVIGSLFVQLREELSGISNGFEGLLLEAQETPGLQGYIPMLLSDRDAVDALRQADGFRQLCQALSSFSLVRFGTGLKKGDTKPSEEDKKRLQDGRKYLKEQLDSLKAVYADLDMEAERERILRCLPAVRILTGLTKNYIERYGQKKRNANIVDYADMEQLTIRVLKAEGGELAAEYRQFFEEVYVDEYQDSNLAQEALLKLVSREDNLFMVGDVKQSIYGFRLARPKLFMDKYKSYSQEDSIRQRIDLSSNFRSRREVIRSVNELFSCIMRENNAGMAYTEAEQLRFGATQYEEIPMEDTQEQNYRTELLLTERETGETDAKELEAGVIAEKIIDLMGQFKVRDDRTGGLRPLQYGDIAILLRTARGYDEIFSRTLTEAGIPVRVTSTTGYFDAHEIALLLDFLRVIDNPRQDIPLAAVLRGPFGRMEDETLGMLRANCPEGCLYDALLKAAEQGDQEAEQFLGLLSHYRSKLGYTPVYELLREIIDGDYGIYAASLPGGKRRTANLNMLLQKADDFGRTSYKGLFQFVRYINLLQKYEIDYGEAGTVHEKDAVSIMTIHKSKGLEFPVCIVAGLAKGYNESDARAMVVTDMDFGLGMDFVDPVRRTKGRTIIKEALSGKNRRELKAEELRVLYVAMTRAKEKLILSACVKDADKEMTRYTDLLKASSHLSLFAYANRQKPFTSIDIKRMSLPETVFSGVKRELLKNEAYISLKQIESGKPLPEPTDHELKAWLDGVKEKLRFQYNSRPDDEAMTKHSVTELKAKHLEELLKEDPEDIGASGEELFPMPVETRKEIIPRFISETTEIAANLHGTAVHRIFELWDFRENTEDEEIGRFLESVVKEGKIEERAAASVSKKEIMDFVRSPLAKRMGTAFHEGKLYREQPFLIELDHTLVQGIIDAFFIENGRIIVVDYKTDRVNESKELVKRYALQLDYYAKALTNLLGQPVSERIIYSTVLAATVPTV
ncbi:MAG: helicase-exonuclease AddAB subunit AddA [Lachnospiraceae bacterium]|nr:helicase-exonuclease AddAB subunit AddA [Lachnospiraceae bacterium]